MNAIYIRLFYTMFYYYSSYPTIIQLNVFIYWHIIHYMKSSRPNNQMDHNNIQERKNNNNLFRTLYLYKKHDHIFLFLLLHFGLQTWIFCLFTLLIFIIIMNEKNYIQKKSWSHNMKIFFFNHFILFIVHIFTIYSKRIMLGTRNDQEAAKSYNMNKVYIMFVLNSISLYYISKITYKNL